MSHEKIMNIYKEYAKLMTRDNSDFVNPSKKEMDELTMKALKAAFEILKVVGDVEAGIDGKEIIKLVLRAFLAIEEVEGNFRDEFKKNHPDLKLNTPDLDRGHIISTAYFASLTDNGLVGIDEWNPYSTWGLRLLHFATALDISDRASELASRIDIAGLDEQGLVSGGLLKIMEDKLLWDDI